MNSYAKSIIALVVFSLVPIVFSLYVKHTPTHKRSILNDSASSKSSSIQYGGIQHCGLLVGSTEKSKDFYVNVFGFTDESELRPTLPFQGAFLRCGSSQIHLMQLPLYYNTDEVNANRPEHGGRDRHVAITINNIDLIKNRLDALNLKYTLSMSGRRALFTRDMDGNAFEFTEDITL